MQLFLQLFEQHSWECFKLIAPAVEQRGLKTPTDRQHAAAMCLLAEDQMNISPGWASRAPLSHLQLLLIRPTFFMFRPKLEREEQPPANCCSVSERQQASSLTHHESRPEDALHGSFFILRTPRSNAVIPILLGQDSHKWMLSEIRGKKGTVWSAQIQVGVEGNRETAGQGL